MKRLLVFSCVILAGCMPTQKEYTVIRETSRPAVVVEEKTTVSTQSPAPEGATPTKEPLLSQAAAPAPVAPGASMAGQNIKAAPVPPVCQRTRPVCPAGMVQAQGYAADYNTAYTGTQMQRINTAAVSAAPVYYAGTYTAEQPTIQYVVEQPMAYAGGYVAAPAAPEAVYGSGQLRMQETQMAVMTDASSAGMDSSYMAAYPGVQTISADIPAVPTQTPSAAPTVSGDSLSLIILQHPVNRDLVKCNFNDANCLASYQAQGYVQLRNSPHFAGHNAVPSQSDYPTRRWRDNNNIPRW